MDAQTVFDTVVRHLAAQGHRAVQSIPARVYRDQPYVVCRYRTESGDKCAFGIFIPDADYDERMEGLASRALIETGVYKGYDLVVDKLADKHPWMTQHTRLFSELQNAHDSSFTSPFDEKSLYGALAQIAGTFDLSIAVLDEVTLPEVWK